MRHEFPSRLRPVDARVEQDTWHPAGEAAEEVLSRLRLGVLRNMGQPVKAPVPSGVTGQRRRA